MSISVEHSMEEEEKVPLDTNVAILLNCENRRVAGPSDDDSEQETQPVTARNIPLERTLPK